MMAGKKMSEVMNIAIIMDVACLLFFAGLVLKGRRLGVKISELEKKLDFSILNPNGARRQLKDKK
jgi:hypothetical protein